LDYATDLFQRAGMIDKGPALGALAGNLRKYQGEPIEEIAVKSQGSISKAGRRRSAVHETQPAPRKPPAQ
jgi:hypothetical protein